MLHSPVGSERVRMISIRGGSGLGDSVYLQSVARHFVEQGHRVEVCSGWPDVFLPLWDRVTVSPFRRKPIDRLAHYAQRRHVVGTTQFQDCYIQAGITEPVDLRLDWTIRNKRVLAPEHNPHGLPVVMVQMARTPFGRDDRAYPEFAPEWRAVQRVIDALRGRAFLVLVGKGEPDFRYTGIDLDLSNATSVAELIDIGFAAHGFLGQCSFIIPIAESFSKPVLLVWSRKGLNSPHAIIRQMTPQKILHRVSSRFVIDDWPDSEITRAADALLEQVRSPVTV